MTDTAELPTVFDRDVVSRVADTDDVPPDRLVALLSSHQASVRDLPGVENLVYEWRRQFDATVLEATEAAYYVAAPPWVWSEFADSLNVSDAEARALERVHERHVGETAGTTAADPEAALVVLDRTA